MQQGLSDRPEKGGPPGGKNMTEKLDSEVLMGYIKDTLGGKIGAEYADPYGQGRITIIQ